MEKQAKQSQYMTEVMEIAAGLSLLVQQRKADRDDPVARLAFVLGYEIKTARSTLAKFAEQLEAEPANALEWADSAIEAAATLQVYGRLGAVLVLPRKIEVSADQRLTEVRKFAADELARRSRTVSHSTGQCSNLVARYELAAYGKLFDSFSGALTLVL